MGQTVGVLVTEHIAVGLVEDNQIVGSVRRFPQEGGGPELLDGMPAEEIARRIALEVEAAGRGNPIEAVGVGFPGINRNGLVEESPNLKQTKGLNLKDALAALFSLKDAPPPIHVLNDAAALAAGIAATRGQLDKLVRVWFLGVGIGFGRYPQASDYSEGGHFVEQRPHGGAWEILHLRAERTVRASRPSGRVPARHGQDEPAARQQLRDHPDQRRDCNSRSRRQRATVIKMMNAECGMMN
jgi:hypothetical protein